MGGSGASLLRGCDEFRRTLGHRRRGYNDVVDGCCGRSAIESRGAGFLGWSVDGARHGCCSGWVAYAEAGCGEKSGEEGVQGGSGFARHAGGCGEGCYVHFGNVGC